MSFPQAPRRALTADELATVATETVAILRRTVGRISTEHWREGLDWYYTAHGISRDLARLYGVSVPTGAGVIAALSPRVQWGTNLDDAREVLEYGDEAGTSSFEANAGKAINIASELFEPDDILGGRKVRSFYRNIVDPHGSLDVTVDGWIAYALGVDPKYLERRGVYDAISDGFRQVAETHGIMPHQLQAAAWVHIREGKVN